MIATECSRRIRVLHKHVVSMTSGGVVDVMVSSR